jgi:hypothetical protein
VYYFIRDLLRVTTAELSRETCREMPAGRRRLLEEARRHTQAAREALEQAAGAQ